MDLTLLLDRLENLQIVRRAGEAEQTFVFKHGLMQEAFYASLLKTQRRRLHRDAAEAIEQLFPERLDELSSILAFHWEQAKAPGRARHYLIRAGQRAAQRYANAEALDLYTRALVFTGNAPPAEVMSIYMARARLFDFLSRYDQALDDYAAALGIARQTDDAENECRVLGLMAWLHWLAGRWQPALELARETEQKARGLRDPSLGLRGYLVAGLVAQAKGHISDAYPRLRQSLYASRTNDVEALEGESLFFLGAQNNFMGRFARAAACAHRALAIKRRLGDHAGEIVSLYLLARAEAGRGRYDAALDALEEGHAVSAETRNPFGLAQYPNTRAWLAAELGDWETAYEFDRAGLETARTAPVRPPEISTLINLILDCTALNKTRQADEYLLAAYKWVGGGDFGFHAWRWQIRLLDAHARILIASSLYDDARLSVTGLLDWAARTQSGKYRARGLVLRARIEQAEEKWSSAEADLTAARDLADLMCYLPVQVAARQSLVDCYVADGNGGRIRQLEAECTALIDRVDRTLGHPDLRRSFERGVGQSIRSLAVTGASGS